MTDVESHDAALPESRPQSPDIESMVSDLTHSDSALRDALAVFQCGRCSHIYRDPVTLPCGRSICKQCLPRPHTRTRVSYPATAEREEGFVCPFEVCMKEHAVFDCSLDYVLGKMVDAIRESLEGAEVVFDGYADSAEEESKKTAVTEKNKTAGAEEDADAEKDQKTSSPENDAKHENDKQDESPLVTIQPLTDWEVAGVPSLQMELPSFRVRGSRLQALYAFSDLHGLPITSALRITSSPKTLPSDDSPLLKDTLSNMRPEADCQVCYAIFLDPVTTPCGHTFCNVCLHRVLDHSPHCPVCRRAVSIAPLLSPSTKPENHTVAQILLAFWPAAVKSRRKAAAVEGWTTNYESAEERIPIFPCTMAYPGIPLYLHIFEPRYRLMVRRCMEGNRIFGMVLPRWMRGDCGSGGSDGEEFAETGTLLHITKVDYFPDGRSMIQSVGLGRFRIRSHRWEDGIVTGSIVRIHDVGIAQEEALEEEDLSRSAAQGFSAPDWRELARAVSGGQTPEDEEELAASGSGRRLSAGASLASLAVRDASPDPFSDMPQMPRRLSVDAMSTAELLAVARAFSRGNPLIQNMVPLYGEAPQDASLFSWWFAAVMPMSDERKYELLKKTTVRGRLKVCCEWAMHWAESRWSVPRCVVM